MSDLIFVVAGLAMLVVLWYANGGPQKADLRGIFLQPPAPVGTGEAYGPTFDNLAATTSPQPTEDPNYYVSY